MPTGNETAARILRILGVIGGGQTPTADEYADSITAINGFLDNILLQGIVLYTPVLENFDLVAGTASYTIGSSGTFNTVWPESIESAYVKSGGYDYPVDIIDERKYTRILDKSTQGRPYWLYYKPNYPLGTLYFYFTPDSSSDDIYLMSRKKLTSVSGSTNYDYPPGFDDFICFNVALRVGPEFGANPSPLVFREAQKTMDAVIAQNTVNNMKEAMIEPTSVRGRTNILNF